MADGERNANGNVNPWNFLQAAIAAVPAVKYALGVGGIAAVVAIVAGFLDLRVALVGVPVVLVLMFLLLIFSHLAQERTELALPALCLVWFSVVMLSVMTVLFGITFFIRAEVLNSIGIKGFYELFDIKPTVQVMSRNADSYISSFEDAYSSVTTPGEVTAAIKRIDSFWMQPEQRKFLLDWRCHRISDDDFFKASADAVLNNPATLMNDVSLISNYFDTIARCVKESRCDKAKTCAYFGPMVEDFRLQYTEYFNTVHTLFGRDPMAEIRPFVWSCDLTTPLSAQEGAAKCDA